MELTKTKFKQTEVGLIPEDWNINNLGSLAFVTKLAGFEYTLHFNSYKDEGDIIVVRGTNITHNKMDLSDVKTIPTTTSNKLLRSKLFKNDLVFAYVGTIGPIFLIEENDRYHLGPNTAKISVEKELNSKYLYHYFTSTFIANEIFETTSVGAQPSLSMSKIRSFKIVTPTLTEQKAIATALSDVDALIASLEQTITKKKAVKQGAMQQLLNPQESWQKTCLVELADNKKSQFDDGDWVESEYIISQGVRLIQTGNIGIGQFKDKGNKKYISEDSFDKLNCKEVLEGDLLVCRLAEPAGRACIMPDIGEYKVITSVDVSIFRGNSEVVNREFLSQLFTTNSWFQKVIEKVGGTTHKRISRGALGKIEIEIPLIEEQKAIAQILSDMDAEITKLETKKEKYQAIKQGMMQELLTGKTRLV